MVHASAAANAPLGGGGEGRGSCGKSLRFPLSFAMNLNYSKKKNLFFKKKHFLVHSFFQPRGNTPSVCSCPLSCWAAGTEDTALPCFSQEFSHLKATPLTQTQDFRGELRRSLPQRGMGGRACLSWSGLCWLETGLSGSPPVRPVPRSLLGDVSTSSAPGSGGGPLESDLEGDASAKCTLSCRVGFPLGTGSPHRVWLLALTGQVSWLLDSSQYGIRGTRKQRSVWIAHRGHRGTH